MNPPWPLSHGGGSFIFPPPVGMTQNHFDSATGVRFITTPLQMNGGDQREPGHHQQAMRQLTDDREPTPQQILDNVQASFPPLRQISVDLMNSWTETDQQQHQSHATQQTQSDTNQPAHSSNYDANANDVTTVALQHIQNHLQSELAIVAPKPHVQKRKRSTKPMPETWKKNVRKTKRAKGEMYLSATGKLVPAKRIKTVDCSKCWLHCSDTISNDQQDAIFQSYWATGSYVRQRDFLCSHVIEEEKARTTVKGEPARKREWTRQYWLPKKSGKLVRVCKSFFLATLDVGCKTIDYALKKRKGGFFCDADQRGKHEPTNKVSEDKLDCIRQHIESFWHLNVSPSKKKKNGRIVLPADYNIRKMYQMYKDKAAELGEMPQKEHVYRRIFNMEYNISFAFLEPKKDVAIRIPVDQAKFENVTTPSSAPAVLIVKSSELQVTSHNKHIDSMASSSGQSGNHLLKNRARSLLIMKPDRPPPPLSLPQSSEHMQVLHPPSLNISHSMPQHSVAPFVLPSNPPRSLDAAVNMSQFSVHPSFIHPHHAN